jgi:hypothetical protein
VLSSTSKRHRFMATPFVSNLIKVEYLSAGVLDNAHLRIFVRRNILNMFTECGFKIELIVSVGSTQTIIALFNLITLNMSRRFFAAKYLIKAKKI